MKKYISVLALCLCMGMQYIAFAAAPCTTSFALGYAYALSDLVAGTAKCKDASLEGPCQEEIDRSYRVTTRRLEQQFSDCCCENAFTECCN